MTGKAANSNKAPRCGDYSNDSWVELVNVSRHLCRQSGPRQDISDKDCSQEVMDRHRHK